MEEYVSRVDTADIAFPVASSIALDLLRRAEVPDQWSNPSALPKMSVGALACHLGRQVVRAAELLALTTDLASLASADAHYDRAARTTPSTTAAPMTPRPRSVPRP